MMNIKNKFQRGDTIVEVLIAMAVLGLVLASSFAIANRSYATGLNAQERNEALKIAESQVELLRIASTSSGENLLDQDLANPDRLFCIDPDGASLERINFDTGATVQDQGDLDETQYPAIGSTGGDCNFGPSDRYYVSIQQTADVDASNVPTGGQIFSVRVYWESILGGASNIVNHEFRTYNFDGTFSLIPPTPPPAPAPPVVLCTDTDAINTGASSACLYVPLISSIVANVAPFTASITGTISGRGSSVTTRVLEYYPTATPGNVTSLNITTNTINSALGSLQEGVQYTYRITAVNGNGTATFNGVFSTVTIPANLVGIGDYNGSRYYVSSNSTTWINARNSASSLGGQLVTISSNAENSLVANSVNGPYLWIGLNDRDVEGDYRWVSGETFSYNRWSSPVQPDNYTYNGALPAGEDCIMMYTSGSGNGRWNDLPCFSSERYVVEFDL